MHVFKESNLWTGRGEGRGEKEEKEERRKVEPLEIHQYFDCRSFIIYAGLSFNYSNVGHNNNNNNMLTVAKPGTLLETRISCSLFIYQTTKLVPNPKQCSFQLQRVWLWWQRLNFFLKNGNMHLVTNLHN